MFAFSAPGESPPPPQRNTHGISSDIRREVSEVRTLVSDIRDVLKGQEGADGQHLSASVTHAPSATNTHLLLPRLKISRQSQLPRDLRLVTLGNYHLRHQGPALDGTS
jgi:hypothetical protein